MTLILIMLKILRFFLFSAAFVLLYHLFQTDSIPRSTAIRMIIKIHLYFSLPCQIPESILYDETLSSPEIHQTLQSTLQGKSGYRLYNESFPETEKALPTNILFRSEA